MDLQRYTGRITTVRSGEHYGFIGLATVKRADGSPHGLSTSRDLFVHQDDCSFDIRKDIEVSFQVVPDSERGGDALRALDVVEVVAGELVVLGEHGESRALADPRSLYVPPTHAQQMRMKAIPPEAVESVVSNRPMPRVPRASHQPVDPAEAAREIISRIFPQFAAISDEAGGDLADESFDQVIRQAIEDHKSLGMHAQADRMLRHAGCYKGLRTVLRSEEDLLTPQTIIPLHYLPDLFMAVPVWYFWTDESTAEEARLLQAANDPTVHPKLRSICDMVQGQRWTDAFLMFNRRMRTLRDYEGDIIPPRIIARMRKMAPMFDHLIIMTPYHDVAGRDWEDIQWLRSIDPYVVGIINGIPLMFVVGRFSDSGVFPLYSELVADTVLFLRQNVEKLRGFNKVQNPYWYEKNSRTQFSCRSRLGDSLITLTRQLLAAFDRGELFDWLREEQATPPVPA